MTLRVISLGAGVQSTTLALMAAAGEIGPMPDCAIFADTGWEPKAVYEHLDRLERALPFPVIRLKEGDIREDALAGSSKRAGGFASIPWYLRGPKGDHMGRRQCTAHYKLEPIRREIVRQHGGKRPKGGTEVWIGISLDEAIRMKPSRVQYIVNRWPLLELGIKRTDCMAWLDRHGWSAPKSACIGCPFRANDQWKTLTPEEKVDAIEVDRAIRDQMPAKGQQFMHRSFRPLEEIDLSTAKDRGQLNLFLSDCEGMCGT